MSSELLNLYVDPHGRITMRPGKPEQERLAVPRFVTLVYLAGRWVVDPRWGMRAPRLDLLTVPMRDWPEPCQLWLALRLQTFWHESVTLRS